MNDTATRWHVCGGSRSMHRWHDCVITDGYMHGHWATNAVYGTQPLPAQLLAGER